MVGQTNATVGFNGRHGFSVKQSLVLLLTLGFLGSVAALGVKEHNGWRSFVRTPTPSQIQKLELIRQLSPNMPKGFRADVCYTDECLDGALLLLRSINFTVDPCQDFYAFSCSRWQDSNPIPGGLSRWSQFNFLREEVNNITSDILNSPEAPEDFIPVRQAKQYYKQCLNLTQAEEAGLTPITNILNQYAGWPAVAGSAWDSSTFDWVKTTSDIRRIFLDSFIYRIFVSQDIQNTTNSVIYLDQPGFFLPRTVLLNPASYAARLQAYKDYFTNVAVEFVGAGADRAEIEAQADEIIAFETRLAGISATDEDRTNTTRVYNPYELQEFAGDLEAVNPGANNKLDIVGALTNLFSTSGSSVINSERIVVLEPEYFMDLVGILDTTDIRTIANYVHWRLVAGLVGETTNAMRAIKFEFDKVNSGINQPVTRENTCSNSAQNAFGMAIGVEYIERAFDSQAKENVDTMVENLRTAFIQLLAEADWMDETTRARAEEKALAMRQFMAFPEWLNNQTRLEQEFAGLELGNTYLESVAKYSNWVGDQTLKTKDQITDKDYWLTYPGVVNAFYSPEFNSITFPAGILQPPFYRSRGLEAINYGGIGVVIGHEITHGFDDQGSQYDANGNAENWWSDDIKQEFLNKAQCIVDQYGNFNTSIGKPINGDLTSGENIADNGGLRQSFLAYQNWIVNNNNGLEEPRLPGLEDYTPDQLFFLGYSNIWCENINDAALENQLLTDPHSPARFRVIGAVQNSATFAEKWNCPAGTPMNPANKCVLW